MDLALGVGLGIGIAAIVLAVWRAMRAPSTAGIPEAAMQSALHAATTTLPAPAQGPDRAQRRAGRAAPARADRRGGDRARRHARGAGDRRRGPRAGAPGRPPLAAARARRRRPAAHRAAAGLLRSDLPAALGGARAAARPGQADRDPDRLLPDRAGVPATTSSGSSRRRPAWSRLRSSCRWSPSRRSAWPRPSCGRCGPRSRRTSSTTRWPPWRATSTPGPRRRASC